MLCHGLLFHVGTFVMFDPFCSVEGCVEWVNKASGMFRGSCQELNGTIIEKSLHGLNLNRQCATLKGTGTRDLIGLKVVSLDRSWLVGLTDDLYKFLKCCFIFLFIF